MFTLLSIVHVACRLADALDYDVTRPLVPRTASDVLSELPPAARQRFDKSPEQLCVLIEKQLVGQRFRRRVAKNAADARRQPHRIDQVLA